MERKMQIVERNIQFAARLTEIDAVAANEDSALFNLSELKGFPLLRPARNKFGE